MRFLDEVIFEKDGEGNRYDPELGRVDRRSTDYGNNKTQM